MSAQLQTHAEIVKIAHLLQVDPDEIEYLAASDAETLRELRGQLVDLFYGDEGSHLRRFAKVGNLLPSSVIASLTRETVGPVLAARIAGFVDPKQAASVVSKLPTDFVLEIALMIDPRRVAPVLGRLDNEIVETLALEMVKREEYVVMGQFASFVNEDILRASFNFASDEALLRIAFVTEDKSRIPLAMATQSDARMARIVKTSLKDDLWPEGMDFLAQLSGEQYDRMVNIAGHLPPEVMDEMIKATSRHNCWEVLVPAVSHMEDPNHACQALLRADAADFRAFTSTVIEQAPWPEADDLIANVSDENREALVKRATRLKVVDDLLAAMPSLARFFPARAAA